MRILENDEASRPGEASGTENRDEFRSNNTSTHDSIKADSSFYDDSVSSIGNKILHNAFQLIPARGASQALWALEKHLKRFKCRYSRTIPYKGWICPKALKELVEMFLISRGVKVEFKEIYDSYIEKSKSGQIADDTWVEIDTLEGKAKTIRDAILVDESFLEDKIVKRRLDESSPAVLKERSWIQEQKALLSKTEEEIKQRRNTARLLDEKAAEENPSSSASEQRQPMSLTYEELLRREIPPREFILKPWLPVSGIAMAFSRPGVGKTYLGLSIAFAVASGSKLFEWEPSVPRKVFYVDGEMYDGDLKDRIRKLGLGFTKGLPDTNYLRFLNGCWLPKGVLMPDLSTREGQLFIEQQIEDAELLVLDNLSTLVRSGKDNDAESWRPVQNWLLSLRWRGVTVLIIHHAGKGKDDEGIPIQRGSSAREIVLDTILALKRPKNYSAENGCLFEGHFIKSREYSGAAAAPFEASLEEENGALVWKYRNLEIRNYDRIVEMFNDGVTNPREIAEILEISRQAVSKQIKKAQKEGDIS